MKIAPAFRLLFPLILSAFAFASCGSDAPEVGGGDGPEGGNFSVFVSKSGGGERAEMPVTGETTFGEVRAFAATEFGLAAGDFRLMVAGKYPEDTEKLGDHGFHAQPGTGSMPVGNIIVRVGN